jgi:hypothetical protein
MQDRPYFAAIDAEMDAGGREALLYYLLNFDLTTVDLRTIPRTAALVEQQIFSATAEQQWWLDTLRRGELPWGCDGAGECPMNRLVDRYVEHAKQRGVPRRSSETKLGMFLSKAVPGLRRNPDGRCRSPADPEEYDACNVYTFPPLKECRDNFARQSQFDPGWEGCPVEWRVEPRREPAEPPKRAANEAAAKKSAPEPRREPAKPQLPLTSPKYNPQAEYSDEIPF